MLPEKWLGTWRGPLSLRPPVAGFPATSPMELRISALGAGRWGWVIAYSGQPERVYELRATTTTGAFVLDEKNGIFLDEVFEGEELLCAFEVDSRLLLTRYTHLGEAVRYETRTFKKGEPGPNKVASRKATGFQSALLKRVGG